MTEHVWKIKSVCDVIFAYVGKQGNYKATMSEEKILARLNATERLSAKMARMAANGWEGLTYACLDAYADVLEGKDD